MTTPQAQLIAACIYAIAGAASLLISYDFLLSKDGWLRKILIFVFGSWGVHYITLACLFYFQVGRPAMIIAGFTLSMIDFTALILLYLYMKWKQ